MEAVRVMSGNGELSANEHAKLLLASKVNAAASDVNDAIDADEIEKLVKLRLKEKIVDKKVKSRLAAMEWTEPAPTLTYSLEDAATMERPDREFYVEKVFAVRHTVTLAARHKSGKTTLAGNLVRSLVDGDPFLGQFEVGTRLSGNVGMWNGEMDAQDFDDNLLKMGIRDRKRVQITHLQGYKVDLLSDVGIDWTVKWLKTHDVEIWIPDPWAKLCSWSGVGENSNDGTRQVIDAIDIVKREAGVTSVFMPIHPPRSQSGANGDQPRARGAASMDEWPDALWLYSRDKEQRYLKIEGRGGVALDETAVVFDPETRLLVTGEGSRDESSADDDTMNCALTIIRRHESAGTSINSSELYAALGVKEARARAAIQELRHSGKIHSKKQGRSTHWYLGSGLPDWPNGCNPE